MGLGAQMIVWEDEFCDALAERGFRVVRFDNRDIGKSTKIDWTPPADPGGEDRRALSPRGHGGRRGRADGRARDRQRAYRRRLDGRHDRAGNGDPLAGAGQDAHLDHVDDRRSELPPPSPEAMAIFTAPPPATPEEYVEANVRAWRVFRGLRLSRRRKTRPRARDARRRARRLRSQGRSAPVSRGHGLGQPQGRAAGVNAPTLVIHGADDPLVPLAAGEDTAATIPGAGWSCCQGRATRCQSRHGRASSTRSRRSRGGGGGKCSCCGEGEAPFCESTCRPAPASPASPGRA